MNIKSIIAGLFGGSSNNNLQDKEYELFVADVINLNHAASSLAVLLTRFKWDKSATQDPELVAEARRKMRVCVQIGEAILQIVTSFTSLPKVDQPKLSACDAAAALAWRTNEFSRTLALYGDDAITHSKAVEHVAHIRQLYLQLLEYLAS